MIKQPYKCVECELESEVIIPDNGGVVQGIHLIKEDHDKLSPTQVPYNCPFHTDNIILYQPTFVDQADDDTVNDS